MQCVAIVGVGLIGASFGLALRKAGFTGEIIGVSSAAAIAAGFECGAISSQAALAEAASRADLIYLAQPVDRILETIEKLGPLVNSGCLITDAGSTKAQIVAQALKHLPPGTFLGGHPLAGKEQRGAGAADADLFHNRPYVLTPSGPETPATQEFRKWLARIGAHILETSPQEHDSTVALTSHLPQLVSTALAATLAERNSDTLQKIFGPGLMDMTRLALSAPELWTSIFSTNKVEVLAALDAFVVSLGQARQAIEADDLSYIFNTAAQFATTIRNLRPKVNLN
ncbi:MAG TPA: prephenate dehydrogenase/arogenate dehydrogenase family protein [Bryobacteraceae bacterium]|jgi:prephenate dehydrogenase